MIATIGPHPGPGMRGVWCVFVDDGSGEDHYRILSTHATRDGAAVSANQVNRAEAAQRLADELAPFFETDTSRCPHDGTAMRWVEDGWYCPRCKNEFHDSDPLNPPGPGDETRSHVYPKSGMVLDQEALLDGTGRWGEP